MAIRMRRESGIWYSGWGLENADERERGRKKEKEIKEKRWRKQQLQLVVADVEMRCFVPQQEQKEDFSLLSLPVPLIHEFREQQNEKIPSQVTKVYRRE